MKYKYLKIIFIKFAVGNKMNINIDEIQKITFLLLAKVKESQGNDIQITKDYYWDITDDESYNPYAEPEHITLGQLSDDVEEVKRLLYSDEAIMYDLRRIAIILKALSAEYPVAF
jgi:hypothetical protein